MGSLNLDPHVQELRNLAANIQSAIDAYARGESKDTNHVAKQCEALQHRAETAEAFTERLRYAPTHLCALMVAVEGNFLQVLSNRNTDETSADDIASATSRPRNDIVRSLRLLSATGAVEETGPQRWRANDKTHVLATKGQIGGLRVSSIPCSLIATKTEEYFGKCAKAVFSGSEQNSPYSYTYGKPMYDVFKDNKTMKQDFDWYMEARKQEKKRRWHTAYPVMAELASAQNAAPDASDVTIVDVGGNRGHDLESFAEATPNFKGKLILQDLPETVEPLKGQKLAFEATAYDFFTPNPVKGARLYLLLACLHNWDDASSQKILKNLANAMAPGYSKLLISGLLLPDVNAPRRAAELDVQMWMLQYTRQRTEGEMVKLCQSAGLEVVKVWENGDREQLVECQVPA